MSDDGSKRAWHHTAPAADRYFLYSGVGALSPPVAGLTRFLPVVATAPGPFGPKYEEAANRSRPSESVTDFAFALMLPSFAAQPWIVTLSPFFNFAAERPAFRRAVVLPSST